MAGSYTCKQNNNTMKKTTQFVAATFIAIVSLVAVACNQSASLENGPGIQQVNFMLTDGPGSSDNVFIDIKSWQIVINTAQEVEHAQDSCNWYQIASYTN